MYKRPSKNQRQMQNMNVQAKPGSEVAHCERIQGVADETHDRGREDARGSNSTSQPHLAQPQSSASHSSTHGNCSSTVDGPVCLQYSRPIQHPTLSSPHPRSLPLCQFCTRCGMRNAADITFCRRCGLQLTQLPTFPDFDMSLVMSQLQSIKRDLDEFVAIGYYIEQCTPERYEYTEPRYQTGQPAVSPVPTQQSSSSSYSQPQQTNNSCGDQQHPPVQPQQPIYNTQDYTSPVQHEPFQEHPASPAGGVWSFISYFSTTTPSSANLGEQSTFRYDDRLERWVEEGSNLDEQPQSVPTFPPTMMPSRTSGNVPNYRSIKKHFDPFNLSSSAVPGYSQQYQPAQREYEETTLF